MARKLPPIVEVAFLDSTMLNEGGWFDVEDGHDSITIGGMQHRAVGYLVDETDDGIILAGAIDDEEGREPAGRLAGAIAIPKVAIVERKVLRRR